MNEKAYLRRVATYAVKCNYDHSRSMTGMGYGDWFDWYHNQHGQYEDDYRAYYANLAAVAKSMLMEGT